MSFFICKKNEMIAEYLISERLKIFSIMSKLLALLNVQIVYIIYNYLKTKERNIHKRIL